ncbi:hypothetical protein [Spongiactinospora rosea]|uniref:hypothetical protein n=1 Tax=Spongiactinospora rosea TaxID=2248750 RepID=UPI001314AFA4|nr:hypothetical protein [Spongiactinospora rosea]
MSAAWGKHEDPDSPKDEPLDASSGGTGSNDDENRTSTGKHGKDDKGGDGTK